MNLDHALAYAAAVNSPSGHDDQASLVTDAEKEMEAFICAVQRRLGTDAAHRAGHYWIDAFELARRSSRQCSMVWRKITIAAASRLAQETSPMGLTSQPS